MWSATPLLPIARPLETAPSPTVDRSTSMRARVRLTAGFQPAIVPSSVANRKRSPLNPLPPLNTVPVGVPPVAAVGLRDLDHQRATIRWRGERIAGPVIERRHAGIVIGDPHGAAAARRNALGIDQVRIELLGPPR